MRRLGLLLALCVAALPGQQTDKHNKLGLPNPGKQDVPYLIHGGRFASSSQWKRWRKNPRTNSAIGFQAVAQV